MLNMTPKTIRNGIFVVVGFIFLMIVGSSCFFSVQQTEAGAVTSFGKLVSLNPEVPGLHFKFPWETAHTIRTSLDKISIPEVKVKTIDNQFVMIDVTLSIYTSDPFKALFKVGEMGNAGITDKVTPTVQSRTLDVFGKVNALEIADRKQTIETDILKQIQEYVRDQFGQTIQDVQITGIHYEPSFEANIQEMVKTRNLQVSAQNILKVRETEAQQNVAVAKGQADAAAATADGAKRVAIANAEASASAVKLAADAAAYDVSKRAEAEAQAKREVGTAETEIIASKVKASGSADAYATILKADASRNWKGEVPNVQLGGNGGNSPNSMVVLPSEVVKK